MYFSFLHSLSAPGYFNANYYNVHITEMNNTCFIRLVGLGRSCQRLSNNFLKIIGIMNRLKFQLPQNILLTIYNSLILYQLNYWLLAWGYESKHFHKFTCVLPKYFDSFNMPRNCTYHNYKTRYCQNVL